jgi:leucyl-tRNA synthetase
LPWDKDWIVETLSDSTVYMAYYTIAHIIKEEKINPEQLKPEVFNYVYFGEGDPSDVEKLSGINIEVLKRMRKEFLYWYPVNLRNSAKELVPNHLTFFIMQHVALFPEEYWPKAIGVNGMVMLEGVKMAKSKGNILLIKDAIKEFGSDTVRVTLLMSAEAMDDPDWRAKNAQDIKGKIESLKPFILNLLSASEIRDENHVDRWLLSRMHRRIAQVTAALEELYTRTAIQKVFFDSWNDLKWYVRRVGKPNRRTVEEFVDIWVRLMAPFMPFIAEELFEALGKEGFASTAPWPKQEADRIDYRSELMEFCVTSLMEDVKELLKVLKAERPKVTVYLPSAWKYRFMELASKAVLAKEEKRVFELARSDWQEMPIKDRIDVANLMIKHIRSLGDEVVKQFLEVKGELDEDEALKEASPFIREELGIEGLEVRAEEEAAKEHEEKARRSLPLRPAIIIE